MAGKTGPEEGAEAVPVEPPVRSEDDIRRDREETLPDPDKDLGPGEPSWPEDTDALRVEAETEAEAGPRAPDLSGPGPGTILPDDALTPEDSDAALQPAAPGKAGPPWDWDRSHYATTADATPTDPAEAAPESDPATPRLQEGPALSETPDPVRAPSDPVRDPAPPPPPRRRGGVGALLLGGMIAAALGFGAAWLARDRLGPAELSLPPGFEERLAALESRPLPDAAGLQDLADRLAETEARLQSLEQAPPPASSSPASVDLAPLRQEITAGLEQSQARAAELEERLAALEARPAAPTATGEEPGPAVRATPAPETVLSGEEVLARLEPRLAEIEASLSTAEDALSGVETALATLEGRVGTNDEALAALDGQVTENASVLETLDRRLGEAETTSAAAVEEARTAAASLEEAQSRAAEAQMLARAGAALAALDAAVDRGEPFEAPLSELEATGTAVPEALAQVATQGVPTLATLREDFPEAARAGLAAARDAGLVDNGGVLGFLRGQLAVRSTAPREGSDPDAVLSRAEAALAQGRLGDALREIATLPEPVRAVMADWIARAQARAQAEAALATLSEAEPEAAPAD